MSVMAWVLGSDRHICKYQPLKVEWEKELQTHPSGWAGLCLAGGSEGGRGP